LHCGIGSERGPKARTLKFTASLLACHVAQTSITALTGAFEMPRIPSAEIQGKLLNIKESAAAKVGHHSTECQTLQSLGHACQHVRHLVVRHSARCLACEPGPAPRDQTWWVLRAASTLCFQAQPAVVGPIVIGGKHVLCQIFAASLDGFSEMFSKKGREPSANAQKALEITSTTREAKSRLPGLDALPRGDRLPQPVS
jgi:hypothetical protein